MRRWGLQQQTRSQSSNQNADDQQQHSVFPIWHLRPGRSTAQVIVSLALATALAVAAVAIIGKRSASVVAPLLPEHTRGTSDLWAGPPVQAILRRWPDDSLRVKTSLHTKAEVERMPVFSESAPILAADRFVPQSQPLISPPPNLGVTSGRLWAIENESNLNAIPRGPQQEKPDPVGRVVTPPAHTAAKQWRERRAQVDDVCTRHGLEKVFVRGGKSWRCK